LEHPVAELVAQAVVHVLEVVDIQEKHADEAVFAGGFFNGCVEQLKEMTAIGEAGQGVELRQLLQLQGAFGNFGFEQVLLAAGCFLCYG